MIRILIILILSISPGILLGEFETIDNGLEWGTFKLINSADSADFEINILRIDPAHYKFELLTSSELACEPQTMRQWVRGHNLCAAFNAGMYAQDLSTSIGYCRNFDHINNSRLNKHNTVLVFNPDRAVSAPVRIIDRKCENYDSLKNEYNTFLQSIRMLGCNHTNVWNQTERRYSILTLAQDSSGLMLVCFCQKPISTHDFIDYILSLNLHLMRMMYLEGGGPANLYIENGDFVRDLVGCIERFAPAEVVNPVRVPVPNVIGIKKK